MRRTWATVATFVLALGAFNLQPAVAASPTDQQAYPADEQLDSRTVTELILAKLRRLHDKLQDASALDPKKAATYARALGFTSVNELRNAQTNPNMRLPVFHISLNTLRAYTQEDDPWTLLRQTKAFLYPIGIVDKDARTIEVRSAALLHIDTDTNGQEHHPRIAQLSVNLSLPIQLLKEAQESILAKSEHCDFFAISIPALKQWLLGVGRKGTCDFIIIRIDLSQGLEHALKNISSQPAKEVFRIMAEDARSERYDMPREPEYTQAQPQLY